jgi:serine beta-lactamase-like protein LACTB
MLHRRAARWGVVRIGVLLLAFAPRAAAAQVAPGGPSALADSTRALFAARGIPGGQVVVLRDGTPMMRLAIGLADVATQRAVTDTTRFRIGSVSKLFTATAAALLWETGALDLDAPARVLVPEFAMTDSAVTPRRLAGHLGGVRHYFPRDFARPPQRFTDVIAALAIFAADSLIAAPGTRYHYSSYGYNLLGAVVERAAREPYLAVVSRRVLQPLALTHTWHERSDSAYADLATGYDPGQGAPRAAARTDLSDRWPSGGYLSTATDIARFADASVRGSFLSPKVRALLFTSMRTADGAETKVGFGWRVGVDSAGRRIHHHGGASTGGRAMLMVWPDDGLVVAITTNLTNARISEQDAMMLGRLALPTR